MSTLIRRAVLADGPLLSALSRQTFLETFEHTCTKEDMQYFLDKYFNQQQIENELACEASYYFIVESAGRVAGYMKFMEDDESFPMMKKWRGIELKRIYVLKGFQGKGLGNALLAYFLSFATQHQYNAVWLGVWEHNLGARSFYERNGFINSGYTHDFPIGNTPQTDYWYWRFL
jgi:ribosomal protein S18 acetylase RimI-like enzyme